MELHFTSRESWRAWLEKHHDSVEQVWLVFFKKHTGRTTISYDAAVEEALCFGWVDSLVKRLDDDRYARKFTPRTNRAKWSESNLARFEKLEASGRMTAVGRTKLDPSTTPVAPPSKRPLEIPPYFQEALADNERAQTFFDQLAPSYQRHFVGWVDSAKRESTRLRRLAETLTLLEKHQKLGLK